MTTGSTISFGATVSGNAGSALTYSWNFDGGAPATSQSAPQISFNTAGVWTVDLQVTDAGGGGGGDQVTVTVNSPGSTSTPTTSGTQTTGPNASHGTTPGGSPGTKQTGTPGSGASQHGTQPATHTKTKTKAKTKTKTSSTQTQTQPTATNPATTTPAATGSTSVPAATTTSPAAHPPARKRAPSHRPSSKPRPTSPTTVVRGLLISDVVGLPASESPLVHVVATASATAPARQAPKRPSLLPIVLAAPRRRRPARARRRARAPRILASPGPTRRRLTGRLVAPSPSCP